MSVAKIWLFVLHSACSLVQERLKMAALLDEALDFALAKAGKPSEFKNKYKNFLK